MTVKKHRLALLKHQKADLLSDVFVKGQNVNAGSKHDFSALGQRGLNAQPTGQSVGGGTVPFMS